MEKENKMSIRAWFMGLGLFTSLTFAAFQAPTQPQDANANRSRTCIAEVNAATPIDVACTIPGNAKFNIQLFAKNGDESSAFDWKTCNVGGDFKCQGVAVGWANRTDVNVDSGMKAVQIRVVPATSGIFRGRLRVNYTLP